MRLLQIVAVDYNEIIKPDVYDSVISVAIMLGTPFLFALIAMFLTPYDYPTKKR